MILAGVVVLVVEDNGLVRKVIRETLGSRGCIVIEAVDGAGALRLAAERRPMMVLQDLVLPDIDGIELARRLREQAGPDVSLIALAGFASRRDDERIVEAGFDEVIAKPIDAARLLQVVIAASPVRSASHPLRVGEGKRVLIADDNPLQLKLMRFRLERLGFTVESATDGEGALALARQTVPDLIVSDLMMPRLDGFAFTLAVRQDPALHDVPIVLVTSSFVEAGDRDLARRAGASELIVRTPELRELIAHIDVLMRGARPITRVADPASELEGDRLRRMARQLEWQVMANARTMQRNSALAAELNVLGGISEAVLAHSDVDAAVDEVLEAYFDAAGIAIGALYLLGPDGTMQVRPLGAAGRAAPEALRDFFGHRRLLDELLQAEGPVALPSDAVPKEVAVEILAACDATSALVVPLKHAGRVTGALLMTGNGHDLDDDDWRAFGQGVGSQVTLSLAVATAFAERQESQRRALDGEQLVRQVVDSMAEGVIVVASDGRIILRNRANEALTSPLAGRHEPEVWIETLDMRLGDGVTGCPPEQLPVIRALHGEAVDNFEMVVRPPGRDEVHVSVNARPLLDAAGRRRGAVAVQRDVTRERAADRERMQAEAQLIISDRMASVGTLAAGVAHEINNPLAAVIANLDLAVRAVARATDGRIPDELTEELQDAREAAERVAMIVRDLRIFSRAEDEEKRAVIDVTRVLDSTLRMAWNEIRHRARLVKAYGPVPRVDGNEARLGQVFLNLVVNAAQAIREGAAEQNEIRVSTETDAAGRVVIRFADTGSGIPTHIRAKLFLPFVTSKPVGVGTGLGLSICHRIVTAMGGEIQVDTELGRGTEFRVILPPAQRDVAGSPPAAAHPVPPAPRRGRVLVIDDEPMVTNVLRRALSLDHEVLTASSARRALELLDAGARFDVILCDLMMPQMTGAELHAELVARMPEQAERVIFVTGGAFTPRARAFLDAVTNARVEKPFDLQALRTLVNERVT